MILITKHSRSFSLCRSLPRYLSLSLGEFIKLHITAQSDPVILVILCPTHGSSQGGIKVCVCVRVCVLIKLYTVRVYMFVCVWVCVYLLNCT